MTRAEDKKKVESEDNRGEKERGEISISLQKQTRTQHATKINNGKPGKQMKLDHEYSFNIGQNKMEQ